jgi:Protein of unknown function (DUF1045)
MFNCARVDNQRHTSAEQQRPSFTRYAIYYTPRPGTALSAFGRSWFGRANDGATLQAFSASGLSGMATPSATLRRYTGLHALFRAPFALRDDVTLDDLRTRLITFATHRKPVETGPLTLARAGRYLVLRPVAPSPALDELATQCVSAFEDCAVAREDEDAENYRHLGTYQRLLLKSFGSANVRSEFGFSIALAGPLDAAHLERVSQALWPVLGDLCAEGVTVDGLSLFGDAGGRAPMRLIGRFGLGG